MTIDALVKAQREFYFTGMTRPVEMRIDTLKRLEAALRKHEDALIAALKEDLNKPASESYLCELGMVYDELHYHIKHLPRWAKNRRVSTPLAQFRSVSYVSPEPYGVVLIMAPWNYPVQLCFIPLIGAISAGNCAIIKPSAYAPSTSHVIAEIIRAVADPAYLCVVEGGRRENHALLEEQFDYIFFTGSVSVGKLVMEAAAKHLTPVTLELGGKSPVIVDETAQIKIAARRIAFGKLLNAGQTCVAPDYVLIHESKVEQFIDAYRTALEAFFPKGDYTSLPHIINDKHYERLTNLLKGENIILGGQCNPEHRLIEPTLVLQPELTAPIMQEEIFGPILPLIPYTDLSACVDFIRSRPKPLALYLFTNSRETEQRILQTCSFGGGCINDTIIHLATHHMGFGGVGCSGMGSYHGKKSFDTFTHERSIVSKRFFPDIQMRYRPYTPLKDRWIKRFLR